MMVIFVGVSHLFLTTGCSLSLSDGDTASAPLKLDGPGANCLDKSLTNFERFFRGETTAQEIDSSWRCASEALKLFKQHVRGENRDSYTAKELRAFIEKYFLSKTKISDPLLVELMRLKQAILGGDLERLTRDELDQADLVLNTVRVESVKILPYMRLLTLQDQSVSFVDQPEFVEKAILQLTGTANVLGSLLGRSRAPYKLADAERLFKELGRLYVQTSAWSGPDSLVKYLPAVAALKGFFIRPAPDAIAPDEWPALISNAGRLYALYLRQRFLIDGQSLTTGFGLRQITILAQDFFSLLDESIDAKEGKLIRYQEIDELIKQVYQLELFDIPVKEKTAKDLLRIVIENVTNPASRGRRPSIGGINKQTVTWLRRDFFGWSEIQAYWEPLSGGAKELSVAQVREGLRRHQFTHEDSVSELIALYEKKHPLVFTDLGTVYFEHDTTQLRVSRDSWTSLNWRRAFIRLALRGYAFDFAAEREIGLQRAQFTEFFSDLRPLAAELNLLDPRSVNLEERTFREANVFLHSSDGNDRLNFFEGVELLSFALSASKISGEAFKDLRQACPNLENDVFGKPMIEVRCYRARQQFRFTNYYQFIPGWAAMGARVPANRWTAFQETIENGARGAGYTDAPFESGELDKTAGLFQYIESLFTRFDENRTGTFSVAEAKTAFPTLRNLLAEYTGRSDNEELMAIFTYVIKYGVRPDKDIWNGLRYLWWKANSDGWSFEADRWQVLKVIANLSGPSSSSKAAPFPRPEQAGTSGVRVQSFGLNEPKPLDPNYIEEDSPLLRKVPAQPGRPETSLQEGDFDPSPYGGA